MAGTVVLVCAGHHTINFVSVFLGWVRLGATEVRYGNATVGDVLVVPIVSKSLSWCCATIL